MTPVVVTAVAWLAGFAGLGGAATTASAATAPQPAVYGVDPNSGSTVGGTSLAIFGSGFTGATSVRFGTGASVPPCGQGGPGPCFNVPDDTRIFTQSPAGSPGSVDILVTTAGGTSAPAAGDAFTFIPPGKPVVDAIEPRKGTSAGGTPVTIRGSFLSQATQVIFGTKVIPCFSPPPPMVARASRLDRAAASSREMRAGAPGAGPGFGGGSCFSPQDGILNVNSPPQGTDPSTVDVRVTTAMGQSDTGPQARFSFLAPTAPIVYAIGPNHGTANGGTNLTIFGKGFSGLSKVEFGAGNAAPACPTGPPAAPLRHVAAHPPSAVDFRTRPTILPGGGGGGFGPCFMAGDDEHLFGAAPPGTGTVDVIVTAAGASTPNAGSKYTYDPAGPPTVRGVAPGHGSEVGGDFVNIVGSGFTGANQVRFGTSIVPPCGPTTPQPCFNSGDDANIWTSVPAGAVNTTVDVVVRVGTIESQVGPAAKYTYEVQPAPKIELIDPSHGTVTGNTPVTLYGSGFAGTTVVTVGTTAVPACGPSFAPPCFQSFADTTIYLQTPPSSPSGTAGVVNVTVTTPKGTSSIPYTYEIPPPPVVSRVSPSGGPANGGTKVHISGSGFTGVTDVLFGNRSAWGFFAPGDGAIEATAPPQGTNPALVDIVVKVGSVQSGVTAAAKFTYGAGVTPRVTALSPNGGPANTHLYISGSGLFGLNSVNFGTSQITYCPPGPPGPPAMPCIRPIPGSDNVIEAWSATHTVGDPLTVHVTVNGPGGTSSASAADQYTYPAGTPVPLAAAGPVVNAVDPNHGPTTGGGGQSGLVQLFGSGFTGASKVTFATTPPQDVPVCPAPGPCFFTQGDGSLSGPAPPAPGGTPGTFDITVTVGAATSTATSADLYTYEVPGRPAIEAVSPNTGPVFGGTGVQIFGSNLSSVKWMAFGAGPQIPPCPPGAFAGSCFIGFGDSQLFTTSPPSPAYTPSTVHITVGGGPGGPSNTSSADQFTYVVPNPPEITKVTPNTGPSNGGSTIFVAGNNFTGANTLTVGGSPTFGWFPQSDHVIQVNTPPGTPSVVPVDIRVSTPLATSAVTPADHFTYFQGPAPTITAVSPNTGPSGGGTTVYISGRDLAGAYQVTFGSNNVFNFFPHNTGDVIEAVSPPGTASATPVDVRVTTGGGTSGIVPADQYTYTASGPPAVRSIGPATGPDGGGTPVIISGSDLGGATAVKFGTANAFNFFPPAPDVLQTWSPPRAAADTSPVHVTVTTPISTSSTSMADQFAYTANGAPTIDTVSPSQGPSGTAVTIAGSNFYGAISVKFGTTPAMFGFPMTPGLFRVVSPAAVASATPVDVSLTTDKGTATAIAAYRYTAAASPVLDVVSPSVGPAGTNVILTGSGLGDATEVDFGATPASFFARSDTLIRATSPAGTGTVDVTVKTAAGKSVTKCAAYTYGTGAGQTTFYFAEGFTGTGFSEKLLLLTPNQGGMARIDYYLAGGAHTSSCEVLTAGKVTTVDVNARVGPGQQVSVKVTLPAPGVAERTLNFNTGTWHGSTDIVGVTAPSTEWDFAEGSTLAISGALTFSEYLTLQNPTNTRVMATLNYFTDSGLTPTKTLGLPPNSRTTVEVFAGNTGNVTNCVPNGAGSNCGVGPGIGGVSLQVKSDSLPIIAERPFYVNAVNLGDGVIRDGHDAFGATSPGTTWNFAEGTTLNGFKEFLTLQNPGNAAATANLNYFTDTGAHPVKTVTVNAHSRVTVEVFHGDATTNVGNCVANGAAASCGVGPGIGGVSVQVTSNQPIVAERPMYMVVNFGTGSVAGAHVVVGATGLGTLFGFAAASTLAGENDYLTIQNPGSVTAQVTITYYANAGAVTKSFSVNPNTRVTVEVFRGNMTTNPACSPNLGTCGVGMGVSPLGIVLQSNQPILVEKPTYNSTAGAYGATDTLGYSPSSF